jgi:hypothetical protein
MLPDSSKPVSDKTRTVHSVLTIHILFVIGALCTYQSNVSINEIDYKEDSLYKVH